MSICRLGVCSRRSSATEGVVGAGEWSSLDDENRVVWSESRRALMRLCVFTGRSLVLFMPRLLGAVSRVVA